MKFDLRNIIRNAVLAATGFVAGTWIGNKIGPSFGKKIPPVGAKPPEDDDLATYLAILKPGAGPNDHKDGFGGVADYRTYASQGKVPRQGWVPFVDGLEITALPILDARTNLYARFSYADALEMAARLGGGARLPTWQEAQAIWDRGHRIKPTQMVHTPYDQKHMQSLAYALYHDKASNQQLIDTNWSGTTPVANVGKWWVHGAPSTRAYLYGWFDDPKRPGVPRQGIPGPPGHHDDQHHDYGTLTYLVRPD